MPDPRGAATVKLRWPRSSRCDGHDGCDVDNLAHCSMCGLLVGYRELPAFCAECRAAILHAVSGAGRAHAHVVTGCADCPLYSDEYVACGHPSRRDVAASHECRPDREPVPPWCPLRAAPLTIRLSVP